MTDNATHPGDLLSALLDGELTEHEAAQIRAHVGGCDACGRELEDVAEARRLLRGLPAVDPPAAFLAEILAGDAVVPLARRRRPRWAFGAAGAAAAVAAALAVVAVVGDGGVPTIEPDLEVALDDHTETLEALDDIRRGGAEPDDPTPATTAPRQPLASIDESFEAPGEIAGYGLVDAYEVDRGVHLLYRRGVHALSVFERTGEIDWSELPSDGERFDVGAHRAWRWTDLVDRALVVIDADGVVVTIVGDVADDVLDVAAALDL